MKDGFPVATGVLAKCGVEPVIGGIPSPVEDGDFAVNTATAGAAGPCTASLLTKKLKLGAVVASQGLVRSGNPSIETFLKASISLVVMVLVWLFNLGLLLAPKMLECARVLPAMAPLATAATAAAAMATWTATVSPTAGVAVDATTRELAPTMPDAALADSNATNSVISFLQLRIDRDLREAVGMNSMSKRHRFQQSCRVILTLQTWL